MSRKTAEAYAAVFDFIETRLLKLEPKQVMTDFENGLRLAIRKRWPHVDINGCWIHYCRAVQRKCRRLGFSKIIKQNGNARVMQKAVMSLPLLPSDRFLEGYKTIKTFASKKRLLKRFGSFFKYFERYWFNQVIQN